MKNILITIILSFFVFSGFSDNQVWVYANLPSKTYSGKQFTVEVTINKMSLKHFAEFKQKLPKGFTAIEKNSQSADFHFKDQYVKLIWLRLPRQSQFKISYEIVVDRSVRGTYNLPGQFTYIYDNQRGNIYLNDIELAVFPPDWDFGPGIPFPPANPESVQCLRLKPFYSKDQKSIIVKLLVSRGIAQGAAKIKEKIPTGYKASLIESGNASFSIDKQTVEFVWNKLPKEKDFVISYKLSPVSFNPQLPKIEGSFMYQANGQLQTPKIREVYMNRNRNSKTPDVNNRDIKNHFIK
ncbi:MAG: hypothetical protein B6I20_09920 [Bacteroidetes bacterium 4572_117]|nr:MAG: hypothetical protein B6I20_09920 [Bacteroidetes bacterium 4572_117]